MTILAYTLGALGLCAILTVFSYLDQTYRGLGRVTAGRLHEHLDVFEAEIEPRIKLARQRATLGFALLTHLCLAMVAMVTMSGVLLFGHGAVGTVVQMLVYVVVEILICVEFVPYLLLTRTTGRWLKPLLPAVHAALVAAWPLRGVLELAISVAHISDEEAPAGANKQEEGIGALMEAAQEEGILADDDAQLIEQVMEFGDKRVLEVMTPRPDIVAIAASATVEEMRRLLVATKFSRVLVYQQTLDDVLGIAYGQDLLQIPDSEAKRRMVRELVKPALFVPKTKLGSELLKEMQRRNLPMAVAVDEHGLVAGVVTVEDLVEEIVGEMGKESNRQAPDVVREADGGMVFRGSVSLQKVQELLGVEFPEAATEGATTVAGLLNTLAGHVPQTGENIEFHGLRFEVVEANQRKVLRLRVRSRLAAAPAS